MLYVRRIALAALVLTLAACGRSGSADDASQPPETVPVTLTEYAFQLSDTTFVTGQPYRFVLKNQGTVAHEWAVVPHGAKDEENLLVEVEEDELSPGATAAETFTFVEPGTYDFACFMMEPDGSHYKAGMVQPITVKAP